MRCGRCQRSHPPGRPVSYSAPAGAPGRWPPGPRSRWRPSTTRCGSCPGPAWSALRDVAELAAVVPLLDADLAGRLPAAWVEARRQLADPVTHGLVRLAADELGTKLRGRSQEPYLEQLDRTPARPTLLRDPAQLPEGMRRLAAVLDDVGPAVAAADVRSVTRLLALGVELTDRTSAAAT